VPCDLRLRPAPDLRPRSAICDLRPAPVTCACDLCQRVIVVTVSSGAEA
jgi:hypothetical protein